MRPTGKSLRVEEIKREKSQSYQSFAFLTNYEGRKHSFPH